MLETILKELNIDINNSVNYFKNFLNKIHSEKISKLLFNDIKIKINNNIYILKDISSIVLENLNTLIITPNNNKNIKIIYKYILENNFMEFDIIKFKDFIKIIIPFMTTEKKIKIINFINKELENVKINIRNIRRNYNDKIKKLFKDKKINKEEKEKFVKKIDIYINDNIKLLENIFNIKKNNLLKL